MKLLILEAETLVANHEGKALLFNKHFAQIMDFLTIIVHFVMIMPKNKLKVFLKLEIILILNYNNLNLQIV